MAEATMSARAGEELMSLYERAAGQLSTVKEKAKTQMKVVTSGVLTVGGGVVGGAVNGYFLYDGEKRKVLGLSIAEAGAVAGAVVGIMNLAGKYSGHVRDFAYGMGAFGFGQRAMEKANTYRLGKEGYPPPGSAQPQVSAGAGYSAAQLAQALQAERARRAAGG